MIKKLYKGTSWSYRKVYCGKTNSVYVFFNKFSLFLDMFLKYIELNITKLETNDSQKNNLWVYLKI